MKIAKVRIDPVKVKEARGERAMEVTAKELGITRQHLWQVETGRAVPSGDILARMCLLYGVLINNLTTNGQAKGNR